MWNLLYRGASAGGAAAAAINAHRNDHKYEEPVLTPEQLAERAQAADEFEYYFVLCVIGIVALCLLIVIARLIWEHATEKEA